MSVAVVCADSEHGNGSALAYCLCNCASKTADNVMLLSGNYRTRLCRSLEDYLFVKRLDGVDIYYSCADALSGEKLERLDRHIYHNAGRYDSNVASVLQADALAKLVPTLI